MSRARTGLCVLPMLALLAGCFRANTDAPPVPVTCDASSAPQSEPSNLEIAPPPHEVVYLEVTPAAAREIKGHVADMGLKRWWLRYRLVPGGCTGCQNKLDLETELTADDYEFVADGIPCVVFKNQRHLVQGARIDYGEKDGKKGFIVTVPHATQRTKDACQKWIMDEFAKRNPEFSRPADAKGTDE